MSERFYCVEWSDLLSKTEEDERDQIGMGVLEEVRENKSTENDEST